MPAASRHFAASHICSVVSEVISLVGLTGKQDSELRQKVCDRGLVWLGGMGGYLATSATCLTALDVGCKP